MVSNVCGGMGKSGLAGKVTGMMLDMDMSELILIIENQTMLEESVKEVSFL